MSVESFCGDLETLKIRVLVSISFKTRRAKYKHGHYEPNKRDPLIVL